MQCKELFSYNSAYTICQYDVTKIVLKCKAELLRREKPYKINLLTSVKRRNLSGERPMLLVRPRTDKKTPPVNSNNRQSWIQFY